MSINTTATGHVIQLTTTSLQTDGAFYNDPSQDATWKNDGSIVAVHTNPGVAVAFAPENVSDANTSVAFENNGQIYVNTTGDIYLTSKLANTNPGAHEFANTGTIVLDSGNEIHASSRKVAWNNTGTIIANATGAIWMQLWRRCGVGI